MKTALPGAIAGAIVLGAVGFSQLAPAGKGGEAAPRSEVYWYVVDRDNSTDLAGSSHFAPEEVSEQLSKGNYFQLDDFVEYDSMNGWALPGSYGEKVPRIWIQPTLVRSYRLIDGKPEIKPLKRSE